MNNNDFKDIINILKIIAPHRKKFNNGLLSKYTNKKFKFRELIKQLNKITINQKNSKNRNLILNIDDVILKKLEEFLLSSENGNLEGIRNMDSSHTSFTYDENNQLTSMFNPLGNNFKFE